MDQDFLLGVFAVQLGFAKPGQVMAAASAWLADRSESIPDRLVASGVLDEAKRTMLESLAAEAIKSHGGDVEKTLHTLGGEQVLFHSFGGSVIVDGEGKLAAQEQGESPEGEADGEDDDVEPASTLDVPLAHAGKYALRGGSTDSAEIGRGGLGRVLVAFDEHLGREVAIKELLGDEAEPLSAASPGPLSRTSAAVSRFLREARVTGQLEHPNIVPVYEVGQRRDGTFYYAMRVVRGDTLGDKLKEASTLGDRLALLPHYVNLCNAIAYAHSRGVVHRDIKPDNVMIGEFGETVVLDWGLAKVRGKKDIRSKEIRRELELLQDAGAGHTVDGSAVGTPAYMSPEQADGQLDEIDERSDVWGLGAVLYELLAGRPPFEGVTPFEILGKVLKDPVEPVRSHVQDVPPELAAVADKALSRERSARYPSAKELADEIEAFLQGQRVGAYRYGSWELLKRFVARNKALSLGVLAVLLTLVAASVVVFLAWGREQQARSVAEQQKSAAEQQRQEATTNLAQAYVNEAHTLVRKRNYNGAYVYAAAALREYQKTGEPLTDDQRVALDSALYQATVRRAFQLEQTLAGPTGRLVAIAMSDDGKRLAVSDSQRQLWVYWLDGSKPPVHEPAPGYPVLLRFSDDGQELLVGCIDGSLRAVDAVDLKPIRAETIHQGSYYVLRLSRDGRRIITIDPSGSAYLVQRGSTGAPIPLGPAPNWGVHFSPDGERIALARPRALALLDAKTGEESFTIEVDSEGVGQYGFTPDGSRVLINGKNGPRIVDLARRAVVSKLERLNPRAVHSATYSSLGWILGHSSDVDLWDGRAPLANETLWRGAEPPQVASAKDGRLVAIAHRGTVRIWSVRDEHHAQWVTGDAIPSDVHFAKDGQRLVFSTIGGTVYFTELGPSLETKVLTNVPGSQCTRCAIAPDGKRAASVGNDQVVKLFDLDQQRELASRRLTPLDWPEQRCSSVVYSPDGSRLFATAPDGRIYVLDPSTLELERALASYAAWAPALRVSPHGKHLLVGDAAGQVAVWDANTLQLIHRKSDKPVPLSDVTTTLDGKTLITAAEDGWVRRYDMKTERWRPLLAQRAHDAWVNRLALSPDGELLLTTSDDHKAKLWTPVEGKLLRVLHTEGWTGAAAFAPTGDLMATNDGPTVLLLPDLRKLLEADGSTLFEQAKQSTGQTLVGFALEPLGEQKHADEPKTPEQWSIGPREWRASVVGYLYGTSSLPADTTVELLRREDDQPFSPPLTETVKDGKVTFRLPDGIDAFATRIRVGKQTTYLHSARHRPGIDGAVNHVPKSQVTTLAARAGVEVEAGTGQLIGQMWWQQIADDYSTITPVGCAEVTEAGGARVFHSNPSPSHRAEPDPRLERSHPAYSSFYVFNLSPGPHELTVRVGDATLKATVRIHADSTTMQSVPFPRDRFPNNPTPPKCMVDWAPEDTKGDRP